MIEVRVMIANGGDTIEYRDCALDVIRRLNHLFLYELNLGMSVTNWDFRLDAPTVISEGAMAQRSLGIVDRSEVVLPIFGNTVPAITSQEMWQAFERRRSGANVEVWTFVNPLTMVDDHTAYFETIKNEFHEEVVYSEYRSQLEFQGSIFTAMFKYLIDRAGATFPGTVV
jgi:hypothetical protein